MRSKSITAFLIVALSTLLFPINASSGWIHLKNGKVISNVKNIKIEGENINYSIEGKSHIININTVQEIGWIADEPKFKREISEETSDDYLYSVETQSKVSDYRKLDTDNKLDKMTLKNMDCLLSKFTLNELKRMSDKKLKKEMYLCLEADKGPFLYPNPKKGKYDWSKHSDEPKQKIWGFEVPIDPVKRKQYFEDMEEENRQLETEIFGRPLD